MQAAGPRTCDLVGGRVGDAGGQQREGDGEQEEKRRQRRVQRQRAQEQQEREDRPDRQHLRAE